MLYYYVRKVRCRILYVIFPNKCMNFKGWTHTLTRTLAWIYMKFSGSHTHKSLFLNIDFMYVHLECAQ